MPIRFITALALWFLLGTLIAQKTQTINYDFKDFEYLKISDDFEVYFTQTDGEESIELVASERLVNKLDVYQEGKTLYLGTRGVQNWNRHDQLIMHIKTASEINQISVTSDAKLVLETPLETNQLSIRVASDAQLRGTIMAESLDFKGSSDGNARLDGKVGKLVAHLASDAYLKAFGLEVENVDIHLSSDAWAELTVTKKLKAAAFSDAHLKYRGNPSNVKQHTGSDAWIKKVGQPNK